MKQRGVTHLFFLFLTIVATGRLSCLDTTNLGPSEAFQIVDFDIATFGFVDRLCKGAACEAV